MQEDSSNSQTDLLAELQRLRAELARREAEDGQHRRLRSALREEKMLTAAISRCVPGIFYVIDERGRMLRWNRGLENITGYTSQEIARMTRSEFFDPDDDARIRRLIHDSEEDDQGQTEAVLLTKDRRRIPYLFTGRCYRPDETRRIAGLGIQVEDGSGRTDPRSLRAQAELKLAQLTPRQIEVLRHVVAGKTNKAIARKLQISEKTVEKHRFNIQRRLEVKSTAELVRLAVLAGLLPVNRESNPASAAES